MQPYANDEASSSTLSPFSSLIYSLPICSLYVDGVQHIAEVLRKSQHSERLSIVYPIYDSIGRLRPEIDKPASARSLRLARRNGTYTPDIDSKKLTLV